MKQQHRFFEEHQLVANFLAKFKNAYESLSVGNINETHIFISNILDLSNDSFQMLSSEYDGFYQHRKGLPKPNERKNRVEHKEKYESLEFETYFNLVKKVLK